MAFNQFTNLDFNSIKSQIKNYLRSNSDFSDFDFEGSNLSMLIDILAYNSYITAFNTNMAVNESFLDSATLRENVVSLARNIGYVPRSKRASRAIINFSVDTSVIDPNKSLRTLTLKSGIVALGAIRGGSYSFSIPDDITVPINENQIATFNNVQIYEGTLLTKTFVIDYKNFNQKFILQNPGIDTTTIRLRVLNNKTETYQQFANIFNVDSSTPMYLVQEILDEKYQIIFGDGVLGKKPENGSTVFVSYLTTNGADANGVQSFTFSGILEDNNGKIVTNGISLVTTIQAAENGDSIENVDNIKYLSPRVYATQYRAVTSNDYKSLIPFLFPNVESVNAYGGEELPNPEYGKVYISVKPKNGLFLSNLSKQNLLTQLKNYSVAGIKPEIIDLKFLFVEVSTSVYYNKSKTNDITNLKNKVIETITKYANSSDLNVYGGRFRYSKLVSLIDKTNVSVTSNITTVKIRRNLTPILNRNANYEVCFGNSFHIKKTNSVDGRGYNIKSTGFRIRDNDNLLYLSDIPISDKQGIIFFFKIVDSSPVMVLTNAGTVNYEKGEIMLNSVIFTSFIGNEIQIEATPESNDIIGLRELFLQLDITKLKVSMIEDTLSSGYNISGEKYFVTSSYNEDTYIR